ncbi:MAG: DNA-binding protein [Candidatus Binatia bacterium]
MRSIKGIVALLAGAMLLATGLDAAGQGAGGGHRWDPATVETVSGEVVDVQQVSFPSRKAYGVHLALKTDASPDLAVALGPSWYVDKQTVKIAKGDRVEVKGSRVTVGGKPLVLAAEVKKGDQTLVLRNTDGIPAWAGAGKRGRRAAAGS